MLGRSVFNGRVLLCQRHSPNSNDSITQKLIPLFWSDFSPHCHATSCHATSCLPLSCHATSCHVRDDYGTLFRVSKRLYRSSKNLPQSPTTTTTTTVSAAMFRSFTHSSFYSFGTDTSGADTSGADASGQGDPLPTLATMRGSDGDPEEIEMEKISVTFRKKFLRGHGIPYDAGYTCLKIPCLLGCCTNGSSNENLAQKSSVFMKKISNCENRDLMINDTTGFFMCPKCKRQGTWRTLEDVITMLASSGKSLTSSMTQANALPGIKLSQPPLEQTAEVQFLYDNATDAANLTSIEFSKIVYKLQQTGITHSTFKKFGVKFDRERNSLLFPLTKSEGDVTGLIVYNLNHLQPKTKPSDNNNNTTNNNNNNDVVDVIPRTLNVPIGLFGWSAVPAETTEVILCADVFDVMILSQAKPSLVALCLPKGTCRLPQYELPQLETFKKITIWFDNDVQSWQQAKLFAQKLNDRRCSFIRPKEDQPAPTKAYAKGSILKNIVKNCEPIKHEAITTFAQLRQEVFEELRQFEQVKGLKWKRFPRLTKILQGHRRGELTVLTGPTGCGKTTFVSEYALDLAQQGTSTLWGSFEISNVRLLKTTLTQYAGVNLAKNLDRFDEFADSFERLPMSFLRFHGPVPLKKVVDVMAHACYVHDITHIIVDNLQFMMHFNYSTGNNFDRYQLQDSIISAFRHFATTKNCHVTLIVHPRKEDDPSAGLGISSIFGSAKSTQEADNVVIMQSNMNKKFLQIVKNRFSGDLGVVPLSFDKETLSFYHKSAISK